CGVEQGRIHSAPPHCCIPKAFPDEIVLNRTGGAVGAHGSVVEPAQEGRRRARERSESVERSVGSKAGVIRRHRRYAQLSRGMSCGKTDAEGCCDVHDMWLENFQAPACALEVRHRYPQLIVSPEGKAGPPLDNGLVCARLSVAPARGHHAYVAAALAYAPHETLEG